MQVSMSKKRAAKHILDETTGEALRTEKGNPILKKAYSVLQDDFYRYMQEAGYSDIERGERGSSEEHLTVTQFKVQKEQERLVTLTEQTHEKAQQAASLEKKLDRVKRQQVEIQKVEQIEARPVPFSSKLILERSEYEALSAAAKKYCTQEHKAAGFKKALDAANKLIGELKTKVAALNAELQEYKSVRRQLSKVGLEQENVALKKKLQSYEAEIERNRLWHLFERPKAKSQKEKI